MTTQTHNATMCASYALRALWVTPLPMLSCHGLGSADCAHASGAAIAAANAIPPLTACCTHPPRCFIA